MFHPSMASQILDCSSQVETHMLDTKGLTVEVKTAEAFDLGSTMEPEASEIDPVSEEQQINSDNSLRAEIDTSAPFESVKEAATRFGGIGFWRPNSRQASESAEHDIKEADVAKVEEQIAQLEKELIAKEMETFDVLKEVDATKLIVEQLKSKLQEEASEVDVALKTCSGNRNVDHNRSVDPIEDIAEKENCEVDVASEVDVELKTCSDNRNVNPVEDTAEKENYENLVEQHANSVGGLSWSCNLAPKSIFMELKEAELNLARRTNDLADIRAAVESYNKQLVKERISLDKTRERLVSNSPKRSSDEAELNEPGGQLLLAEDSEDRIISDSHIDITKELQRLNSEVKQFKKMGESARLEVSRTMSEIDQTKTRIKTAEMRWVAAKKMKAAARAAEAVALAEIKALSNCQNLSGDFVQKPGVITLSYEEYCSLTSKAQEAVEASKRTVVDAMLEVEEANVSKEEILKKVEKATEEVKSSKKVLEDALNRVEAAHRGKLALEEALQKKRLEHNHKRLAVHSSTEFKNPCSSHHRKSSPLVDVNGIVSSEPKPFLRPALTIGEIMSRKLLLAEDFENRMQPKKGAVKRKVSLAQMLSRPNRVRKPKDIGDKQVSAKRVSFDIRHIGWKMN